MSGLEVSHGPLNLLYAFGVGLGYDLITFIYVAWPMVLFLWLVPARRARVAGAGQWLLYLIGMALLYAACLGLVFVRWHVELHESWPMVVLFLFFLPMPALAYSARSGQMGMYVMGLTMLFGLLFVAACELVFWNEFSVRFNFIAVDYLVYTTEVIGNIRESYPIFTWVGLLLLATLVLFALTRSGLRTRDSGSRFWQRA